MSEKNKISWNEGAAKYSAVNHSDAFMQPIIENPANAFHPTTWEMIGKYMPDLQGKKICVPSSGDNHAVFAFAMLGARITSCDLSENQLANAQRVAQQHGWDASIEFVCADTMRLEDIKDGEYDFVYTSNGVHVWIDDLPGMYRNIHRILKPGGVYMMYEIHPFQRPFDDRMNVKKPYDSTGPFESDTEITFGWRIQDIVNAMLDSGLSMTHMEEMYHQKNYDWPFWISYKEYAAGVRATPEEVDRMYDWHNNPMAALPTWISIAARKE